MTSLVLASLLLAPPALAVNRAFTSSEFAEISRRLDSAFLKAPNQASGFPIAVYLGVNPRGSRCAVELVRRYHQGDYSYTMEQTIDGSKVHGGKARIQTFKPGANADDIGIPLVYSQAQYLSVDFPENALELVREDGPNEKARIVYRLLFAADGALLSYTEALVDLSQPQPTRRTWTCLISSEAHGRAPIRPPHFPIQPDP